MSLGRTPVERVQRRRDDGSILPLALVISVVISLIVMGIASYTATTLRHGQVAEDRADRLSAAEGGMRHMLEQEQEANSLCTTAAGAGGLTYHVPGTISEAATTVHCKQVGSTLSNITAWAIVVTGAGGVPSGMGLEVGGGAGKTKVFGGPSYVANKGLVNLSAPLEMREGNLWYTDAACLEGGEYVSSGPAFSSNLSFDPTSRGLWCTDLDWTEMFHEPSKPTMPTNTNPGYQDIGGCRVFSPGRYTAPPALDDYNYFKSGDYYFDNAGTIEIKQAGVTAGREGVAGSQQEIDNPPCDVENGPRDTDVPQGATFYMGGSSRIEVLAQGSFEILRRQQGYDFVSIHALASSTLDWNTAIITSASGNNKQMALQGQVWAPRAAIEFGQVTNDTVAQLTGGAVVARAVVDTSASITGFVIEVQGSPQSDKMMYTATATKNGTTSVRVIAQLRFSRPNTGSGVGTWELAINSWRVINGSYS